MPRSSAGGKGMPQGVEGKVPDVSILQQAVVVILESFLRKNFIEKCLPFLLGYAIL